MAIQIAQETIAKTFRMWTCSSTELQMYVVSHYRGCGLMTILTLGQHADQPPLYWRGRLVHSSFVFDIDQHLAHLASILTVDYELYEGGYWHAAELYQPVPVHIGDILIYRPRECRDVSCLGLPDLIRRWHHQRAKASPYTHQKPVPVRYRA